MIRNSKFGGLIPRIHTRILPNGSAEVAVDVNLEHGSIKPWPRPALKCDVGQDIVTVHFDKNCACVTWPIPVDVVDYIAGGCEFKIWNERDRLRIESPSNFCNGLECFLGVPCPTEPLLIDDDGFYVYTWINKFGQESPPSILSSPGSPIIVLTDCNEIWEIGTLVPDLHVAGVVAGVYDGDLIEGTGELEDDRIDNIHTTNDTDNYTDYAGFNPGFESGVARVFFPECQWYDYAGPLLKDVTAGGTFDLTDAAWVENGAFGVRALDTEGIGGLANRGTTVTDNNATWFYQLSKFTTSGAGQSSVIEPASCKWIIRKEAVATHHARLLLQNALGAVTGLYLLFNVASGATRQLSDSDANNMFFEVRDNGDWWEVYMQIDTQGDTGRMRIHVAPSWNADGSDTQDSSATGSIRVAQTSVFLANEGPATIGQLRGSGAEPKASGASSVVDISNIHIPSSNHSDTEGGYYIEWRPLYSHSEISADVEILSLNDSTGLLYYDYSELKLTATDGTNTATVDLVLVKETKYRLGVIFGDFLRVGVDTNWGTPVAYDGGFAGGGEFDIFRNPEAVNYWRELRGFEIPYLDVFNEVNLLMNGGQGDIIPAAPDPDPQVEIVAPFWANTGNWIDLSALAQTTFAAMFGVAIEDEDFDKVVAVNKAALVNTADVGNRIQLQDSIDAQDAALFITDASGNVVDSMIYDSTPNSDSVLVPTGSDHYVVITSDTGNAQVRKWDTSTIDLTGSTPWADFFGVEFGSEVIHDAEVVIPAAGIGLAFTIPATSDSIKVSFGSIEVPAVPTTRTGSVNQTVGDYTSDPTFIWGNGTGFTGGINLAGQDIALIPGKTYIFNIKNDTPGAPNFIRIQTSYVVQ